MYAIYVNSTKGINYAEAIVKGYKTMETRTRDVFKSFFKDSDAVRIAVIDTSRKTPMIVGCITLHKGYKVYKNEFYDYKYFSKHLVPPGSKYGIQPNADFKWCYELTDAISIWGCPAEVPTDAIRHGRSFCEI